MMQSLPITRKQLFETWQYVISVPYGDLQNTLSRFDAMFYNCGYYGWNYNVYEVNRTTAICTGYRPVGNIKSNYEYNKDTEHMAKEIKTANNFTDQEKEAALKILLETYARTTIAKAKQK